MLFHLPKFPAEIRISHLNARVNEQRKKIAQTTASRLELLQLVQQLAKEYNPTVAPAHLTFVAAWYPPVKLLSTVNDTIKQMLCQNLPHNMPKTTKSSVSRTPSIKISNPY